MSPALDLVPVIVPRLHTVGPEHPGIVTRYGVGYNGHKLGCGPQVYQSTDTTIIAVGPAHQAEWPCGTQMRVCGAAGCIVGYRQDACPGCGPYHLDLSEAGINRVCGDQANVCRVTIQQVEVGQSVHLVPRIKMESRK